MDAYAYLIRHGWSGSGNPLNPDRASTARGGLGLTKPLLVARRSGNSGVGNKTTKDPTNQWWLRGFEDALKGLGGGDAPGGDGDTGVGKGNALTSELYRHFVRGETIPGTLGGEKKGKESGKKRKRGDDGDGEKEEKRVRREEKKRRKVEKEEKRERRREKKERKERKAVEKVERKRVKTEKKMKPENDYPTPMSMDLDSTDAHDGGSSQDPNMMKKLKKKDKKDKDKKDKEKKKDKASAEEKNKKGSSSDERSKRKSKKSRTTG